ncbi:MAG: SPFH domain-containing protein [Propionicimonas sp.]|uniref:SPFH domain-containing protein n=1 Tax=Propionicimonas sp. TaxID=1955623 RepID=UPI003D10AA36
MPLGLQILVLVIFVPLLALLVWALVRASIVRVPVGSVALLVVRGRATDHALPPGVHWVPALRRRQAVEYPSVELSYRASADPFSGSSVEGWGPPVDVILGDRASVVVSFTVRFRLDPASLRVVHERFGVDGIWSAVRDDAGAAIATELVAPTYAVDSFFGEDRIATQRALGRAVGAALEGDGITVTAFSLGQVNLGRHGEVIQATVRSRLEAEREENEASIRMLRVRHDAELAPYLSEVNSSALVYRQAQVWQALADRMEGPDRTLAGRALPPEPKPRATPPESGAGESAGLSGLPNA